MRQERQLDDATDSSRSLAAAAAAAADGTARRRDAQARRHLNFAVDAEPPDYDCHGNDLFAFIHPVAPHYSTLLKFDGKDYPKVKGDLAQTWTVSPDNLTYTFKLHTGVKFHDGSALHVRGRQGELRAHHQSADRRRSRCARRATRTSADRHARRDHRRLQAEGAERRRCSRTSPRPGTASTAPPS